MVHGHPGLRWPLGGWGFSSGFQDFTQIFLGQTQVGMTWWVLTCFKMFGIENICKHDITRLVAAFGDLFGTVWENVHWPIPLVAICLTFFFKSHIDRETLTLFHFLDSKMNLQSCYWGCYVFFLNICPWGKKHQCFFFFVLSVLGRSCLWSIKGRSGWLNS